MLCGLGGVNVSGGGWGFADSARVFGAEIFICVGAGVRFTDGLRFGRGSCASSVGTPCSVDSDTGGSAIKTEAVVCWESSRACVGAGVSAGPTTVFICICIFARVCDCEAERD